MLPLLAVLLAADPDPPPVVRLPAEVAVRPGRLVTLKPETAGKLVRWASADPDADLLPFPDGKLAAFVAAKPGRYLVFAWTAAGDVPGEAARCVVVVGDAPTPSPADPLADALKRLYAADPSPTKAADAAQLAALYREAVAFADRADVATAGELAARIRTAAGSLIPADSLVTIRKRLADEIVATLPADADAPLTPAVRQTAATLFTRLAAALEGLK